ncbi:helicase associated domain-containing protein [Streptomyces sp. SAS_281]|uniref:helicase associated domain-containing protein n=1 Tax=Streptomyces sp. SAS_281 TaxID=3412744 RepID=UPI00403CC3A5
MSAFLRTRVYRPESLVWLKGYQAPIRWRKANEITGLHAVPYDVEVEVTKSSSLGRWVHQQRESGRAGELGPHRAELLDSGGRMVWEPGEEAWARSRGAGGWPPAALSGRW